MNIYAKTGDKVVFAFPDNGYKHDQETCAKYLKVGNIYTVDRTNVGGSHTTTYLQEFPDVAFNSVMFLNANTKETKKGLNARLAAQYDEIVAGRIAAERDRQLYGLVDKLPDHGMAGADNDELVCELQEKVNELVEEINKIKKAPASVSTSNPSNEIKKLFAEEVRSSDLLINSDLVYRVPPETFTVPPTNAELMDKLNEIIDAINMLFAGQREGK